MLPTRDQDAAVPPPGDTAGDAPAIATPICFLLALTVMVPIAPEARLTLFDLLAGILILRSWRDLRRVFRPLLIVLGISLAAMILSAHLNGSEMRALVGRGYQMIVLVMEAMAYFALLSSASEKGRSAVALGAMAGVCCHYFYPTDIRVWTEPIKFLLGIPLGVALLALYSLAAPRGSSSLALAALLMMGYAMFCLFVGSRSIGGVWFASALIAIAVSLVRIPDNYPKLAPLAMAAIVAAGYAVTELYTALAIAGYFGDRAAGIAAFQSSYGSIILGGRPEIMVNFTGIGDAPLLGVGILNYPAIYVYEMINLSIYSADVVLDLSNILYHSAVFATAFESGVPAALLYAVLLYRTLFALPLLKGLPVAERAVAMPLLMMTAWHLLFSPPIPYNRFLMGLALGFVYLIYDAWQQARETTPEEDGEEAAPAGFPAAL